MPETQPAEICPDCKEAQHVHFCPKPPYIRVKRWQQMDDIERLNEEFNYRKSQLLEEYKSRPVTINESQGLYVIPDLSGGYSCLGFDVAFRKAQAVYDWIIASAKVMEMKVDLQPPNSELRGKLEGYEDHKRIMDAGAMYHSQTRARCPAELHPRLIGLEGHKVEVTLADGIKKKFRVGKSTGWFPTHLYIEGNQAGGEAIFHDEVFLSLKRLEG